MVAAVVSILIGLIRALLQKRVAVYFVIAFICVVCLFVFITVLWKNIDATELSKIPDVQEQKGLNYIVALIFSRVFAVIAATLEAWQWVAGLAVVIGGAGVWCYKWWKRKKTLDRLFDTYKPSHLKAENVGVTDYMQNEYIPLFDRASFLSALQTNVHLILLGQTKNGKSRAVYEELRLLRDKENVILVPSIRISNTEYCDALEKARSRLSKRKVLLMLDDVDKLIGNGLSIDSLFDDVKYYCGHTNVQIVMTLRNEQAATVFQSEEVPEARCISSAIRIQLRLLTEQEANRLMPKGSQPSYFDGTPGSLGKNVIERVSYFIDHLSLEEKKCYYIVQRFYQLNVIPMPYAAVRVLAAEHEIDGTCCDKCFIRLRDRKFVIQSEQNISPQSDYEAKILNNDHQLLGIYIDDYEIVSILLSEESYYKDANKAAIKLRSNGKKELSWRIFSITLGKVASKNPQDYVAGAMLWEQNGNLHKAIEMLQAGLAEKLPGGYVISTKLGEIFSRQEQLADAIEALSEGFSGDKFVLRNLVSQVMKQKGAYAALMMLEDKIDLLNGENDIYIKNSVHAMYSGDERSASEEIQKWLNAYKIDFDITTEPFNRGQTLTWNKRLTLASLILRVYSKCCVNIDFFQENARFLARNFQNDSLKLNDIYGAQYHVAQRYFDNSVATLNKEELVIARNLLEELTNLDSAQRPAVYNTLCNICCRLFDYENACIYGKKATTCGSTHAQNWLNYAVALYGKGKNLEDSTLINESRSACDKFAKLNEKSSEEKRSKGYTSYIALLEKDRLPQEIRSESN